MNITLYSNASEDSRVNKALTEITTLTGTLRNSTDVLNPVIVIQYNASIFGINYAYIPEFNRYYFITGITVVNNDLYQLEMHVDVLTTYKTGILNLNAIIERQEKQYNLYLNDPMYKVYQDPIIIQKKFPRALGEKISYVLLVAGGWQLT